MLHFNAGVYTFAIVALWVLSSFISFIGHVLSGVSAEMLIYN